MRTSTRRFFSILFATALTAAAIFIYALFIVPTIDEIKVNMGELKQNEDLYAAQKKAVDKVKEIIGPVQSDDRLRQKFASALPAEDPQISSIVSQLNGLAVINSVKLNQISTQVGAAQPPPKDTPFISGIGAVKVTLEVSGNYESVKKFIGGVETNLRIMDVTQITVDEEKADQNLLRAKISIDAYYQGRPKQAQSKSAATSTTTTQ